MPLTLAEETALIEAVRRAAAAEILPRFRQLDADAVVSKTHAADLVTIADQRAEAMLTAEMATILPGALVVGEEAVEDDPSLPTQIAEAPRAVIIDPVDGTWNFAAGLSTFGVILAVTEAGETVFGLLYDPLNDDWVLARQGGGCWYVRPGAEPVRCTVKPEAPEATGFMTMTLFPEEKRPGIAGRAQSLGRIGSLHCACHEYRLTVLGKARFVLGFVPKAWDHAAGHLAVREAGGVCAQIDGAPYRPGVTKQPVLVAASQAQFDAVVAVLTAEGLGA